MRTAILLVILLGTIVPPAAAAVPRLRGTSTKETRLIEYLLAHSATARALAEELESSDLIIYVELTASEAGGHAATRFVVATDSYRFLRIVVGAMTHPADRAALLAHELQHAVEIARAREVRDDEGVRRLYRRIGDDRAARHSFETTAAREIGLRVRRELIRGLRVPPAPANEVPAGEAWPLRVVSEDPTGGASRGGGC
jgi:hypothetical protein